VSLPVHQTAQLGAADAGGLLSEDVRTAVAATYSQTREVLTKKRHIRWLTPASAAAVLFTAVLCAGFVLPIERYLTPRRGIGYVLGIIGGSLMLLLLLYSARKRLPWFKFLGSTARWFRAHMLLGVLGPLCILYHSGFRLGAANSNVALFSMLAVASSGLVGRYIYARVHHGLFGSKLTLGELQQNAAGLRASPEAFALLPELMERVESAEHRILGIGPRVSVLIPLKLLRVSLRVGYERLRLRRYARQTLRRGAGDSSATAAQRSILQREARRYIDERLLATRRVAGFQAWERLFSLWHALHLPLIFILLAAGVVHVIAVNVY
jgi:hypothetical protein